MTFTEKDAQKIVDSILDDVAKIIRQKKKGGDVLGEVNRCMEIANHVSARATKKKPVKKSKKRKQAPESDEEKSSS